MTNSCFESHRTLDDIATACNVKRKELSANKVGLNILDVIKFHFSTPTNARIKSYGQPKFMKKKIHENFETLAKLNTNNKIVHSKFQRKLISFIANNKPLFYKRIREEKIREIHGDLYLRNIFIVNSNVGIE
jgi:aminoglycoside phosphotransferase family enzyme